MLLKNKKQVKNGLKFVELSSLSKKIDFSPINSDIPSLEKIVFPILKHKIGNFILYLDYKVLIGIFRNSEFVFPDDHYKGDFDLKYLLKLRIFNEKEELMVWKIGNGFGNRYRLDSHGTGQEAVESYQVLFGTKSNDYGNGFTLLKEKRGTEVIVPGEIEVNDNKKRVFLKTRNYIDYHEETRQASYKDCRFMGFYDHEKNLIEFTE
ncbi:MAG: CRISPR-associated protein Csx19 [Elusimicrobiota bacterium]